MDIQMEGKNPYTKSGRPCSDEQWQSILRAIPKDHWNIVSKYIESRCYVAWEQGRKEGIWLANGYAPRREPADPETIDFIEIKD